MIGEKSPLRSKPLNERNRLWLLKKYLNSTPDRLRVSAAEFFLLQLG